MAGERLTLHGQQSSLMEAIVHGSKAPAVSVVIATYNRGTLVMHAIASVLQQTWTDYELIVVDDGSTDDTRERVQLYKDRIRYLYQPHRGQSSARNTGSQAARGRWLAYLDSDDIWHPTKLERQFGAVSALGEGYGACFTNCSYKGNPNLTKTLFEIAGFQTADDFGTVSNPVQFIMNETFALCIPSLLVLRSVFDQLDGFSEKFAFEEDKNFIYRASFLTKMAYVTEPLISIDRTPGIPRLTDFSSQRDDRVYRWHEQLLNGMLNYPKLVDPDIRRLIERELTGMYYDWTAAKIVAFDMTGSVRSMGRLRSMGQGRGQIVWTLLRRAVAKVWRARSNRD